MKEAWNVAEFGSDVGTSDTGSDAKALLDDHVAKLGEETTQELKVGLPAFSLKTWEILTLVNAERRRQDALVKQRKFSWNCGDSGPPWTEKFLVLEEEVGEVAKEIVEWIISRDKYAADPLSKMPPHREAHFRGRLRTELIQVAAICTAWAETLTEPETTSTWRSTDPLSPEAKSLLQAGLDVERHPGGAPQVRNSTKEVSLLCQVCGHGLAYHSNAGGTCQSLIGPAHPCLCTMTQLDIAKRSVLHVDERRPGTTTTHKGGDAVSHPAHYNSHPSGVEAITVVEHMTFNVGNAVKYTWRAGLKSKSPIEDLKKAVWYLNREVERLEKENKV